MAKYHGCGWAKGRDCSENGSSPDTTIMTITWEHGDCVSMPPADRTFDLVINKGDLYCSMCYSDQIEMRMNMYRDEVDRVLRIVDLKDEDCDSDNT